MKVLERTTRENFFEDGYLRVNPDIAEYVAQGGNAWQHFVHYGEQEARTQISPVFMSNKARYAHAKYERFKDLLEAPSPPASVAMTEPLPGTRGFKFFENDDAFPIIVLDGHFSRGDYAVESSNNSYPPFVHDVTANPTKLYLDLGCGLRTEVFENCLYLEVYPSLTADVIVAPDCSYPLESESFDGIGCFSVLEHVTTPWKVAREIHRMLKPGGQCFVTWPFLQPVHGFPSHYYNATRRGLELMFAEGFHLEFCRTEAWETPDYTILWVLGKFLDSLPPAKKDLILKMSVADVLAQPRSGSFWTDILEQLPDHVIAEFACGNSLVATKR